MKKVLSLILTVALLLTLVPTVIAGAEDAAASNTLILPITHDTYLASVHNYPIEAGSVTGAGDEIHGDLDRFGLTHRNNDSRRAFGLLRTDALTDLKAQLDSGKMISKVELQAYIASGTSSSTDTEIKFFPASTNWDESTINLNTWRSGDYQPNFQAESASNNYVYIDEAVVPTDTDTRDYSSVADGNYVAVTYDITNTFNKALEVGISEDSIFSFMMARPMHSGYSATLFASSEAAGYEPVIKVTLKEKKYEITSTTANTNDPYFISESGNKKLSAGGGETATYGQKQVAAYPIPLPQVSNGKYLESLKLTFREAYNQPQNDMSAHINIFKFNPQNAIDLSTLKFSDVAQYEDKANCTGSVRATGVYTIRPDTKPGDWPHSYIEYEADLTEYAHECLAAGKTEMIVLMNCNYAFKFVGTNAYGVAVADVRPKYTASIASNPEITLADSTLDVGGSVVDKAEFKFKTQLSDDALSLVKLYKGDQAIEEAEFSLTPSKTKIVMNPITLDENASYRVVLKAGAEDLFGNESQADIELESFDTTENLVVSVPKIVAEDFDAETDTFAAATEIGADVAAGTKIKAITEITNNSSKKDEIYVVVVTYKGGELKEVSAVSFESSNLSAKATKIYTSKAITLAEGCDSVKAFVWAQNQNTPLVGSKVITLN